MEVYIDDMLVKSTTAELHITHMSEAFQILREYNMKLNPVKCAFGVSTRKFLGFIVNYRGIEENPYRIKVVLDMPPPSSIKEVQRLIGRIATLSRFVSKASDKCQPFFQVLKKAFQWKNDNQQFWIHVRYAFRVATGRSSDGCKTRAEVGYGIEDESTRGLVGGREWKVYVTPQKYTLVIL